MSPGGRGVGGVGGRPLLHPEDEGAALLRSVGNYLRVDTA